MDDVKSRTVLSDGKAAIRLPARREKFSTLRDWLGDLVDELGATAKVRNHIQVAADEVFTNIASYAYPISDESGEIEIEVRFDQPDLTVSFSDSGVPFNPLETPEPKLESDAEHRPIGGLGVFLVRKLMDSVEYHRENDRNVLSFRKAIFTETE